MRRPLRRFHLGMWLVITPILLAFIGYALTRAPIDRTDPDAPAALFETEGVG